MKRICLIICIIQALFTCFTFAEVNPKTVISTKTGIYINGQQYTWSQNDGAIIKINNVLYVPLAVFSNSLSATYQYDKVQNLITLKTASDTLKGTLDKAEIQFNEKTMVLSKAPVLYKNKVYLPSDYYALFNYKVIFNNEDITYVDAPLLYENIPAFKSFVDTTNLEWNYSSINLYIGESKTILKSHATFTFDQFPDYGVFRLNNTWAAPFSTWKSGWNDTSKTMTKAYLDVAAASPSDSEEIYTEIDAVLYGKKKPIENKWLKARSGTEYQFNFTSDVREFYIKVPPKYKKNIHDSSLNLYAIDRYTKSKNAAAVLEEALLDADAQNFYTIGGKLNWRWQLIFGSSFNEAKVSIYNGYQVNHMDYCRIDHMWDEIWVNIYYSKAFNALGAIFNFVNETSDIYLSDDDRQEIHEFIIFKILQNEQAQSYMNQWYTTKNGIDYMYYNHSEAASLRLRKHR